MVNPGATAKELKYIVRTTLNKLKYCIRKCSLTTQK